MSAPKTILLMTIAAMTGFPLRAQVPVESSAIETVAKALAADGAVLSDGRSEMDRQAAKGDGPRVPGGLVVSAPMVLLGGKTVTVIDGAELIAWMKAKGPTVRIGHSGAWSATLECALSLQEALETRLTLVAATSSVAARDMLKTGAIDVLCEPVPAVIGDVKSGAITAYVLASDERLANLWDVVTADQAGVPLFSATAWLGLYADSTRVAAATATAQKVLADAGVIEKLAEDGWATFGPPHQTAEAHRRHLAGEADRRAARLTADGLPLGQ